jgi:hypothetical protein
VKTALTLVLMALGGLSLSVTSRAAAQQPTPRSTPIYVAQQPALGGTQAASLSPQAALGGTQAAVGTAEQATTGNGHPLPPDMGSTTPGPSATEGGLLLDNGLWDGASAGPCCAVCGGGSCAPPDWYLEQDVRILNRLRPRDLGIGFVFGTDETNTIGTEVLNSRTATPNISAVWDMTFGHRFARDTMNRDHFIEFTFWGLNNWHDEAVANGHRFSVLNSSGEKTSEHGDLYSGYAVTEVLNTSTVTNVPILNGTLVPGFDRVDTQSTFYLSSTNNFEINGRISPRSRADRMVLHPNGKWRRECQPGIYMSYLYGLRFMQINETFRFHGEGRTDTFDPTTGALIDSVENTGDYDIVTHNNLLGFQIGADLTFRQCRWSWGVRSKLGPYINFCDQESNISAGPALEPDFVHRLAYAKHQAALIGEVGFEATYKFRPNLVGHASYDFIWVSGVALAPEQLQFDTQPANKINGNGLAFFNGIKMGLEWLW